MPLAHATITYRLIGKHLVEESRVIHRLLTPEEEGRIYRRIAEDLAPAFFRWADEQEQKEMVGDGVT